MKVGPINTQFSGLALMEGEQQTGSFLRRSGHIVEVYSDDILLDTGSTQTLIRKDMLPGICTEAIVIAAEMVPRPTPTTFSTPTSQCSN